MVQDNSEYIKKEDGNVYLISPTFGDKIKIRNPAVRFGSSKNALKELMHVEEQILGMGVLPDFGYDQDNYILDQHESQNKWRLLTGLIGDNEKFSWLMGYIKIQQLQQRIKQNEEKELAAKQARAM